MSCKQGRVVAECPVNDLEGDNMNILHVIASPARPEESASKKLAQEFFTALMERDPEVEIDLLRTEDDGRRRRRVHMAIQR